MITSNMWIGVICLGALMVTVGNIRYNSTKETEKQNEASKQVYEVLKEEIERNLQIAKNQSKNLEEGSVGYFTMQSSAWETISSSGLLVNLPSSELNSIISIYSNIHEANKIHKMVIEFTGGIHSALTGSGKTREQLKSLYSSLVSEIEEELQAFHNSKGQ